MHELIDLKRFEQIKATGDLPSPKGAALAVIRLTQRESLSIAELTQAVRTDPAFVGRLVKAANGALEPSRRPVVAIQDALNLLGIPAVRSLALGLSLVSSYRVGKCQGFDYPRYWSHSVLSAVAMQALSLRTRMCTPDEAFCVGLLARVGELALASAYPDHYGRLLVQRRVDPALDLMALERDAFSMTHAELSAAMLSDWGFPEVFIEPVFRCDDADHSGFVAGSRHDVIARALELAHHLGDVCLAAESERRNLMPRLFMLGGRLSIDAESLSGLCDRIATDWADWAALLNVGAGTLPPFAELSTAPEAPVIGQRMCADGQTCMRVLVVDDEASIRGVIRALLEEVGHEVFEASNGQQGFEMALELRPQLMVVDWMMPQMDGIELTRALRETKAGRGIYILFLTALEDEARLVEAFESGVDDFMNKPLNQRVFAARLRAGQRVVQLQREIERDREEIRKFAAELSVTNRRLQEVALTDALTGFPNRRYAMERFAQEWAASTRTRRPLACMMIDVDAFKAINDTYGHDIGDIVLKQTAAALKSGLRTPDVVCRIGGDEFLVICPDTDLVAAMHCGERVRQAVAALSVKAGALELKLGISAGVAVRVPEMPDFDALIKVADQGVYLSKQRGRNCVSSAQTSAAKTG